MKRIRLDDWTTAVYEEESDVHCENESIKILIIEIELRL